MVEAVNFNDPIQTVIAGTKAGVDKACGAQGRRRQTCAAIACVGAFHSSPMRPAAEKLRVAC